MEIYREQNVASYAVVPLVTSGSDDYKDNPTLASGDVKIIRHTGGSWNVANLGTLPAAISGATRQVLCTFTATELNPDDTQYPIILMFVDQTATKEWKDQTVIIWTRPQTANATQILGTAISTPATAGILDVNLKNIANSAVSTSTAQLGVNAVNIGGTAQTGRDIGASVLLSNGTGTGQVSLSSGKVNALVGVNDITGAMTEAYNTDGSAPTLQQALYGILQFLTERSLSSTTMTIKKLDGSTTAMTFTLDSATAPTSLTRAS